ncbi:hypothetical protein [Rubrivirga sp.]|uniref:hypothetical protein n=1 Tax=Rubrivirga sp. TaxID=1885344 RepID=UPI003C778131
MRLALFTLLFLVATGCDSSSDELRLDNDYYVGSWELVSVSDGNGDQTALINTLVDDLTADFEQDGGFRLDADLNSLLNTLGQEDIVIEGTYTAQPDVPALVLQADGFAPSFQVSADTRETVALTAPAAVVGQLLGPLDAINLAGDVTLTVRRI